MLNEHDPILGQKCEPGDYYMQGDVLVHCESKLPNDFESMPKVTDNCLAYGEITGHAHRIIGDESAFDLRECPKTKVRYLRVVSRVTRECPQTKVRHLRVVSPVMLKHEEHRPIEIAPGEYRIGIQKEYDPFEKLTRRVAD